MTAHEGFDPETVRWLESIEPGVEECPAAFYNPDGDSITFLIEATEYYGQRVDDRLTVYRAFDDDRIVGSYFKGVRIVVELLTKKMPGFAHFHNDRQIKIEHLFRANFYDTECVTEMQASIYMDLAGQAERTGIEATLCEA